MTKTKKLLKIVLSVFLVLCLSLTLFGCIKKREDCIPKKLGKAEGLYLYYDNYRSLTDGSQTETLLNDITVDGVTYSTDEYEIFSLEYMTDKKEIFYTLKTQKEEERTKYFLWHYNYDTKESGWLRTFDYSTGVYVSNNYVYTYSHNNGAYMESTLFDGDLNFITDDFDGRYKFYDDCLYSERTSGKFSWWKDGKFYEIETVNININYNEVYLTGDYAYLFYSNMLFLIDLNTGEYKTHIFDANEILWDREDYVGRTASFNHSGDKRYFITTSQNIATDMEYLPLRTGCKLWSLDKLEVTHLYTFDQSYQVEFQKCDDRYLNFKIVRYKNLILLDYKGEFDGCYDLKNNKFVKRRTKKTVEKEEEQFKIGDYVFYTDYVTYGPIMSTRNCYYLHRITDGKDEILQYYFDEDDRAPNPVLFDDIHIR